MGTLDNHVMHAVSSITPDGNYIGYLTATKFILVRNQSADQIVANAVGRKSPFMLITVMHKEIVELRFVVWDESTVNVIEEFLYGFGEELDASNGQSS